MLVAAQDATEDEEAIEDTVVEDEDDEAEVEEDEPTELVPFQGFLFIFLNTPTPIFNGGISYY